MFTLTCTRTHTYPRTHTTTHIHTCTHSRTDTHAYRHTHALTYMHTHMCARTHTLLPTRSHTRSHIYTHAHARAPSGSAPPLTGATLPQPQPLSPSWPCPLMPLGLCTSSSLTSSLPPGSASQKAKEQSGKARKQKGKLLPRGPFWPKCGAEK